MAIVVELHVSIQTTGFALRAFAAMSRSSLLQAGSPKQEDSEPDSASSDSEQASGVFPLTERALVELSRTPEHAYSENLRALSSLSSMRRSDFTSPFLTRIGDMRRILPPLASFL